QWRRKEAKSPSSWWWLIARRAGGGKLRRWATRFSLCSSGMNCFYCPGHPFEQRKSIMSELQPSTSKESPTDPPKSDDSHHRPRRWPWILGGVILLIGVSAFFLARQKPKEQTTRGKPGGGPPSLMIGTATARKGDIGVYVSALG